MINNINLIISWLSLFMIVPASSLQANQSFPTADMISGIPACPNHWVPRDATECRHLPCNVSMETLRSPKLAVGLVWCRWFSAWIGIPLKRHTVKHQQHSIYIKFRSCTYHLFTNEDTSPVGCHGTFLTSGFVTKGLASAGPLDNQNMVGAERCLG